MAYSNKPVKIPEVQGKITLMKKADRTYVRYEFGRTYDPAKKNSVPQRVLIGLQIRTAPTLMLPNENYEKYFDGNGEEKMTGTERKTAEAYEAVSKEFWMLCGMFDQLYFEFQIQAHRNPKDVVNAYKIQRINKVLVPLKRLMAGEDYASFLEIPEEPREVPEEALVTTAFDPADGDLEEQSVRSGKTKLVGLDYSDVALLLTQYKGATNRFMTERL